MTYNVGHQFFHAPVTGLVIHPVVPFAQIATLHDHISGTQVVITLQLPKIAENICGTIPVRVTHRTNYKTKFSLFDVHSVQTDSRMIQELDQSCRQSLQAGHLEYVAHFQIAAQLNDGCFPGSLAVLECPFHVKSNGNYRRLERLDNLPAPRVDSLWFASAVTNKRSYSNEEHAQAISLKSVQ